MKEFIACALAGAVLLTFPAPLAAESAKDLHVPKGAHVLLCKFTVTARDKTTPPMALVMTDPSGKMLAYDGLMAYGHLPLARGWAGPQAFWGMSALAMGLVAAVFLLLLRRVAKAEQAD